MRFVKSRNCNQKKRIWANHKRNKDADHKRQKQNLVKHELSPTKYKDTQNKPKLFKGRIDHPNPRKKKFPLPALHLKNPAKKSFEFHHPKLS